MDGAVIAAVLTGVAGVVASYAALVRARKRGSRECEDRLRIARVEAEDMAAELHALRMRGEIDLVWLLGIACFAAAVVFGALALSHESTGPAGERGPAGVQGERGEPGARGPAGVPGSTSTGSSSTGAAGATGSTGSAGAQGEPGATSTGAAGAQGPPGPAGAVGAQGQPGEVGAQGERGATGSTGAQGARGAPGPTCPVGTTLKVLDVKTERGGTQRLLACVPR
jgi:hypothetical protein